ncbi:Glycosyltransferase involved in cell wall bisynthesis [Variovorax sp. HW608]|uniref:glycosyltransferase family 4 protein n=1 Tax=Variovorax sp. HW608 TaxID=1034889 RepID=UPI00081FA426|nr:glycosyltransferase family 1 protein [Variovorax sp. HW608]SCK31577.1 Glycosyltransferase involved in cell wall bisynthesis [Variovorax sp. HW608]
MRIVIDLQGAQTESRLRGIGRYSISLASAMIRNRRDHEVLIALSGLFPETIDPIRAAFKDLLPQRNIRIWAGVPPVAANDPKNDWRRHATEVMRENFLASLRPDVVHVSSFLEGFSDDAVHSISERGESHLLTCATFYDAIPLVHKAKYLDPNPAFAVAYFEKLGHLRRADLLLAISESARDEAVRYLGMPRDQVVNIGAAAEPIFKVVEVEPHEKESLGRRFGFKDGFVMYSGATDERKNHLRLIEAFSLLDADLRASFPLLIVGGMPSAHRDRFAAHARTLGLTESEVIFTGRISDDDLVALYNLCSLFVLPSLHEGFGLPALEAMLCGAPVIGSNTSSVPEVINCSDALFDPYRPLSITRKMAQVLSDKSFRRELALHGLNQAARFSWDASAILAIDALERLVKSANTSAVAPSNEELPPRQRTSLLIAEIARITESEFDEADLLRTAEALAFNIRAERPTLFLDISTIVHGDAKSGVQRVVRSLLHELLNASKEGQNVVPIYFEDGQYRAVNVLTDDDAADSRYLRTRQVVQFNQGDKYLSLDLNAHLAGSTHELLLGLQRMGVEMYFIIYDILIMRRPDWWAEQVAASFRGWLRSVVQIATGLICISATVARELGAWLLENPPDRSLPPAIRSFHLGADLESSHPSFGMPDDAGQVLDWIAASTSFLMVGTVEPRKGHAQALAAFELLWQQSMNVTLVVVGKKGWLVDEFYERLLNHPEQGRRLFVLGGASDEYLDKIYAACSCLLMPSEGEGFGLPLIEAAIKGKPIVARDIPVFREIAGTHAHYFKGLAAADLADCIRDWMVLHEKGLEPRSIGMQWLTWRQSADQLLAAISEDD